MVPAAGWLIWMGAGYVAALACGVDLARRRDLERRERGMLALLLIAGTLFAQVLAPAAYLILGRDGTRRLVRREAGPRPTGVRVMSVLLGVVGFLVFGALAVVTFVLGSWDRGSTFDAFDVGAILFAVGAVATLVAGLMGARASRG